MALLSSHVCVHFLLLWWVILTATLTVTWGGIYDPHIGLHDRLNYARVIPGQKGVAPAEISLNFIAFHRVFNLRLRQDVSIFTSFADLMTSQGDLQPLDTSHIYEGELLNQPGSSVHGSIIDGVFAGTIYTPEVTYYVQRVSLHPDFRHVRDFHSVIYAETEAAGLSLSGFSKNWSNSSEVSDREHNSVLGRRVRRAVPDRSSCRLFLQSDPKIWTHMTTQLRYTNERARLEIVALMASHVQGVTRIFENTVFGSGDSTYTGMTFMVSRIRIMETGVECPGDSLCGEVASPEAYLDIFSSQNHNDYCLAYSFTYQDFAPAGPQLAKLAHPGTIAGGVCETHKLFFRFLRKSLNVGVVSLLHREMALTPRQSTQAFVQAMGRSFGATDDALTAECSPGTVSGSADGDFLMSAAPVPGDLPNNALFSPCSRRQVGAVLDSVYEARESKTDCFAAASAATCGNRAVEDAEVCDCGTVEECTETCCEPRGAANQCTLRMGAFCSPSMGPCCAESCQFSAATQPCAEETECTWAASCTGFGDPHCPAPRPKPDLRPCNSNTQICVTGVCQGSICQKIGWQACVPTNSSQLCHVACQNPSTGQCVSTTGDDRLSLPENAALKSLLPGPASIPLPPGAPCGVGGYCDESRVCHDLCAKPVCEAIGWEECSPDPPVVTDGIFIANFLCNVFCHNPVSKECVSSGNTSHLAQPGNEPLRNFITLCSHTYMGLPTGTICGSDGVCDEQLKCNATGAIYIPDVVDFTPLPEVTESPDENVTTAQSGDIGLLQGTLSLHLLITCVVTSLASILCCNLNR